MALSDAAIRSPELKPKPYELKDGGGLSLLVHPSGTKTWRLRYTTKNGDRKRHTLGSYPDMGLSKARDAALKWRGKIKEGADPQAQRVADRQAMRMSELLGAKADEGWYLQTHVKTAGKHAKAMSELGVTSARHRIQKHLRVSWLLRKVVSDVDVSDLQRIKAKTTPGTWRKLRDILRVCLRHAEEIGARTPGTNPASKVKAIADRKVERYLTPEERQRLDAALDLATKLGRDLKDVPRGTTGGLSPQYVRLYKLLALTGCRLSEIRLLRWEEVDFRLRLLRLPISKTGRKDVPLSSTAIAYLKKEKGTKTKGLVCESEDGTPLHRGNVQRAWRKLRTSCGLDGSDGQSALRLHDLRHSWASDAVSAGVPLFVVGSVFGHSSPTTTARYAHLHDGALRAGVEAAAKAIEKATRPPKKKAPKARRARGGSGLEEDTAPARRSKAEASPHRR